MSDAFLVEAKLETLRALDEERAAHVEAGWPTVLAAIRRRDSPTTMINVTGTPLRLESFLRTLDRELQDEIDAALDEGRTPGRG